MGTAPHVLPDILPCGLRAVICGTAAAGDLSYRRKAYYADYRNCFWDAVVRQNLSVMKYFPFNSLLCSISTENETGGFGVLEGKIDRLVLLPNFPKEGNCWT